MEITFRAGTIGKGPVFLTDGYMNLAILPATTSGEAAVGLSHFGFHGEEIENITKRLLAAGRYAEYRGTDPCGNAFDASAHGFQKDPAARTNQAPPGFGAPNTSTR